MWTGSRAGGTAVRCVLVMGLVGALAACATTQTRVDQFETFAVAGVEYADAIPTVLDEAFEATVETSSLVLEEARPLLDQEARLMELETQDSLLAERLAVLTDLKRHAQTVRGYFVALQSLARADLGSSGLSDLTEGLVARLGDLSPAIRSAAVGGRPIGEVVAPAVAFTVGQFQSTALEDELRRHAPAIERELALQHAALEMVADAMRADLGAKAVAQDRDRIVLPYAGSGALPSSWSRRRLDSFRRQLPLSSVEAAAQAADTLRLSFVALVEGRLGGVLIGALVRDVTAILAFTESMTDGS